MMHCQGVYAKGTIPFSGVTDITDSLKRLEIGSSLGIVELLHISALLTVTGIAKNHFEETEDSLTHYFDSF